MSRLHLALFAVIGVSMLLGAAQSLPAATIASWTFETSVPTTAGPLSPEIGTGVGTSVHANTGGTHTNPSGNGSAESWNSNFWTVGDYYQFQVSTLGQSGLAFAWDQTRSTAGPGQPSPATPNFRLQYSTDGVSFTNHVDYLVPAPAWDASLVDLSTKYSQNLSAISGLDNQANVYFRLTAIQAPQNTGGQSRVDNVTVISGVPEPASLGLVILAAGIMAGAVRRVR